MSRWKLYLNNPAGKNVGDCAVRAVSAALDVDWETAFALLARNAYLLADMPSGNTVIGSVLRLHGFKRYAIGNHCPDCYTADDFARDHPQGTYVLFFGNHVATIRDGSLLDSWDSSRETPQFYWERKDE